MLYKSLLQERTPHILDRKIKNKHTLPYRIDSTFNKVSAKLQTSCGAAGHSPKFMDNSSFLSCQMSHCHWKQGSSISSSGVRGKAPQSTHPELVGFRTFNSVVDSSSLSPAQPAKHVSALSRVRLFVTPWTVARQAPLSMEFSRQEFWSGLPFHSPRYPPDPEIKPMSLTSPALQEESLPLCHL